jgi:hypothetical protein
MVGKTEANAAGKVALAKEEVVGNAQIPMFHVSVIILA